EVLVALRRHVGRAHDMRLAGVAEFEFRPLFPAIGAMDQKHVVPSAVIDPHSGSLREPPLPRSTGERKSVRRAAGFSSPPGRGRGGLRSKTEWGCFRIAGFLNAPPPPPPPHR